MSKFRERAAEVKAAGEEARGDFTPHGVPLRMYNWWLANSPSEKADAINSGTRKENFCHFWRVVAIWTPLLWALKKVLDGGEWVAERVTGTQAAVAGVTLLVGVVALVVTTTGDWSQFLSFLGFLLLITTGIATVMGLIFFLIEKTEDGFLYLMGTIVLAAYVFMTYAGFKDIGWWVFLIELGIVAGLAALIVTVIAVGEWIEGARANARRKAKDADEAAWNDYMNDEGPNPYARKVKQPGRLSKFFSGVGDFLVLATQVVRVNKWKICPLVEVEPVKAKSEPEPFLF